MPSISQRQQRFFGAVKAGAAPKPKEMTDKAVDEFASTPRKGLPESAPTFMADGGGSGHWMERAFRNAGKPGHSLHDTLGVSRDKPIPTYRVQKAAHSGNPKERMQAQAALNARGAN